MKSACASHNLCGVCIKVVCVNVKGCVRVIIGVRMCIKVVCVNENGMCES